MKLYGKAGKSIPQKIIIHLLELLFLFLSFWILFQEGGQWLSDYIGIKNVDGQNNRRIILYIFNLLIFIRMGYMMFFLLKRKIPWGEAVNVPFAFAIYYIGFSILILPTSKTLGGLDYLAITLFIIGCMLNSGSEIQRNRWKKRPENMGKIYTSGFFKYSRHINYFGDLLWVSAYALLTGNFWSLLIVLFLFCFFTFYNAPKLDKYLKEKYGAAYDEYASKTKMLIPYIY